MAALGARYLTLCRSFATLPKVPACSFIPNKYEGPKYEDIKRVRDTNVPPALNTFYKQPLLFHQGHMQWLFDQDNRRYLDLFGGICTISVGHCHPKLSAAVNEQMKKLWHSTNIYYHPKIHEYVEKLASKMPGKLKKFSELMVSYFKYEPKSLLKNDGFKLYCDHPVLTDRMVVYLVNSGTEANDLALVLARTYTGNHDVITLRNSYHGDSSTVMSLMATQYYKLPRFSISGVHHAMLPDPYHGIFGGCRDSISQPTGHCSCGECCKATDLYIQQLDEIFKYSIASGNVAAMYAEPIQGVGGTVQYTKGYLKKAKELVNKHGGLFIADEVQTGFGRTGDNFWGFQGDNFVPDIVTMAKGIGNGYPLAAVVTTPEIAAAHKKAAYFNTFGGNPIASTVGKTVLEIIEEEKLQDNCIKTGEYFIKELMNLQSKYKYIGDVRGKGLMLGLELVEPDTKNALSAEKVATVMEATKDMGVLFGKGGRLGNVLRIKPPMCITREDVDFAVAVLDDSLKKIN